jgi:hypothetical protein
LAENALGIDGIKPILDVVEQLDNIISLNLSGEYQASISSVSESQYHQYNTLLYTFNFISSFSFRKFAGNITPYGSVRQRAKKLGHHIFPYKVYNL